MDEQVAQLKKKLEAQGISGLALDIDETLSDTGPHWWEFMMKRHPVDGLTQEEILEKYRFIEHVPGWQTDEAKKSILEGLESDEFNETVPLLHQSNSMVLKLHAIMPVVAYITARMESVRGGTQRWLDKHGFPAAELILRPGKPGMHGLETKNTWKAQVLKDLYPQIVGIVDDNPGLLDALADIGYQGKVFVYGQSYSERFRAPTDRQWPFEVIISPTWEHVLDHFQK